MQNISLKKYFNLLNTTEIYTVGILLIYVILSVVFFNSVPNALDMFLQDMAIIALVFVIAYYADIYYFVGVARKFYLVPFIYFIYTQIHVFIPIINPILYDNLLISWDLFLFGGHPTQWLEKIANPNLTEYLQFAYMLFFFMPIAHGVELHFRKKDRQYSIFTRQILLGFYVSYLLYLILPAIGPRFCLHDYYNLSLELPGLWLADHFRHFIDAGGGIPSGVGNAADFVNRDCMPSGHSMMTLMNIWLAFKFRSHLRFVFLVLGSSLIFATIYLRYHYMVDLLAGVLFAALVLMFEPYIHHFIKRQQGKK